MFNQDEVIKYCVEAARNHAYEVEAALIQFVACPNKKTTNLLRIALVAQSEGHEASSHDGSAFKARSDASKRALLAWDGPPEKTCEISLGEDFKIRVNRGLAKAAHFTVYDDGTTGQPTHLDISGDIIRALSEGLEPNDAIMRAISLFRERNENLEALRIRREIASLEKEAAGMRLAAEREVTKRHASR